MNNNTNNKTAPIIIVNDINEAKIFDFLIKTALYSINDFSKAEIQKTFGDKVSFAYQLNKNFKQVFAIKNRKTNKLITGNRKPAHKYWQRKDLCETALKDYIADYDIIMNSDFKPKSISEKRKQKVMLKNNPDDLYLCKYFLVENEGIE